jgi:hypothetical protein
MVPQSNMKANNSSLYIAPLEVRVVTAEGNSLTQFHFTKRVRAGTKRTAWWHDAMRLRARVVARTNFMSAQQAQKKNSCNGLLQALGAHHCNVYWAVPEKLRQPRLGAHTWPEGV